MEEELLSKGQLIKKATLLSKAIDAVLKKYKVKRFYIGKTSDYEDREDTHFREGYLVMWEIAKGIPKKIAQMEKHLIGYYLLTQKGIIDNKAPESTGPDGEILYVCFTPGRLLSRNELIVTDINDLAEGLPIEL